jgi:predicted amidohydrolase
MSSEIKTIRVAVAQPYTTLGDVDGNLDQVLDLSSQAALNSCRIILFPETALHGYSVPPEVLEKAETVDGKVAQALIAHAAKEDIVLAVGLFERDTVDPSQIFISHFIAFPNGELLVQRKGGGHEKPGIARNDPHEQIVFDVDGVKMSVTICIDSVKPGIEDLLVEKGCQIQFAPTAGGGAFRGIRLEDFADEEAYAAYEEAMEDSCFPGGGAMRKRYLLRMALATANLATGDDGCDYYQQGHSYMIDSDGALVGLIPGTYVQEHYRPKLTWADFHARTPQKLPPETP